MDLPFTRSEFFGVFVSYNTSVWPLQVVFNAAAVLVLIAVLVRRPNAYRLTLLVLALLWLWMGVVYHYGFFRPINPIAAGFAALFIVEALLLLYAATSPGQIAVQLDSRGSLGGALVAYGLLLYPIVGRLAGHKYPEAATFGLPCPSTLFTVGVLLWVRPLRPTLFVIPVLWSLTGITAALRLGVYEDTGLGVSAIAGFVAIIVGLRRRRKQDTALPTVAA
jgi:hypothetical protein